ncbi:hypothetical protein SEA_OLYMPICHELADO_66 [Streptomyces phage OlympicHelado]|uniref:Uncharacterized protein n=1 Tax=Streptomyces phage OlympicHelado TaxID=1897524 RepID=A0A1I9SDK4_9CAUD|nr:hypothetical protein SEA_OLYMPICHELADO_66 [Streptomyces phage OlympicHelado]
MMVSSEVVERARCGLRIQDRYDNQEVRRVGGNLEATRKDWTPAQKRRMRKKLRKLGFTTR